MSELEETAYNVANFVLILTVTDLAAGLILERTGILPGAERMATAFAGVLFVLTGIAGLVLVILSWRTERAEPAIKD